MSDYQYQSITGPLATAQPAETRASWMPCIPAQVFRRKGIGVALTVAACVLPSTFAQGAINPPTGWRPTFPHYIHKKRTLIPAAHLVSAQNLLPLPPLTASGGSVIATGTYDLWQYQALTGPLHVAATPAVDYEWLTSKYPDQVRKKPELPVALQRAWTFDKWDAPAAPTVPDFLGLMSLPDFARSLPPSQYRAPSFAMDTRWTAPPQAVDTTLWQPRISDRPFASPYRRAVYTWAHPEFVIEIDVPVMSWTGLYLDPPVLRRSSQAALAARYVGPLNVADVTDPTPSLSWAARYPVFIERRRQSIASQTAGGVVPAFLADVTDTVPVLSARAIFPDQIAKALSVRGPQAFFFDKFTAPAAVTVPDLYAPIYPVMVQARTPFTKHPSFFAPEYVLDVTLPAPTLAWQPTYPAQMLLVQRLLTALQKAYFTDTLAHPVTPFNVAWVKVNFYIGAGPAGEPEGD